jgi:glycosyltransferase involved in cell wall biosynthesis/predicted O-methyltransferase YrrM/cyclopropane fatty-acyl-phospholipid synthase-like methyltransferase/Tfp pilus assembly protein PilF
MVRTKNIIISGTNFWNPGDDFVRDGVIRVLREVFPGELLNFLFYNFNADFFPQNKFAGIGNYVSQGDLEKYRDSVDAVIIAGLSAGDEIKDLYRWVMTNGLADKVYLIGAGYENSYAEQHISEEPESTIFRKARIIIGRTAKTPEFIQNSGIPYHHLNCPAILSVPEVRNIPAGKRVDRIGFSIQLPHGEGLVNQSCDRKQYEFCLALLRELSRQYQIEVIAHHKTEYFYFLKLLHGENIPVVFSSFYQDLHQIYPRYDLVITTRLHASLFANGHGIPGIIVNDTDRHTHTLEGFRHSTWVNTREKFDRTFAHWTQVDLAATARELAGFKTELLSRYVKTLAPIMNNTGGQAVNGHPAVPQMEFAEKLRAALCQPDNKRRVHKIISGLEKDYWLERNLVRYQDSNPWFDMATLLNWLARVLKPKNYLEIGVRRGRSMAQVLVESPETRAFGFDLWIRDYGSVPEQGIHTTNPGPEFVLAELAKVGVTRLPQLTHGDSHLTVPAFFKDSTNPQFFDIILVDGDHTTAGARADLELTFAHLAPGGALIFDDICNQAHPELLGLWNEFARRHPDYLFLNDFAGAGTGVALRPPFDRLAEAVTGQPNIASGQKAGVPARESIKKDLPIHFFTIVLNGQPFIQHHINVFKQLPFCWHWHIVEGVAELNHDTAWSKATGGKIPDGLHRNGLSVDGTTEYLDALKKEFPENVTIYRPPAGKFWDGKREMVNAPLENIREQCLLWQVDADELWTFSQLVRAHAMFRAHPEKTAARFYCHFFVGPELIITSRDTYGNHSAYEWQRVWRFQPGDRWAAHEPPRLHRGEADVASLNPFSHVETEAMGLVFQHYAYATDAQLRFKEIYYGYAGAVEQWSKLQRSEQFPQKLSDHFAWVKDGAVVDHLSALGIQRLAPEAWLGIAKPANPGALDNAQRILFVRTDSIGDAVLASSMLEPIRKKFPQAKLAILCQQHVADLFVACPSADSIICYDRKKMDSPAERAQIVAEIAAFNPDLILNSVRSRDHLSNELTLAFRNARHVAIESDLNNISAVDHQSSLAGYEQLIPSSGTHKAELARHADFLRGLELETGPLQPAIWTASADEELASAFFQQEKLDPTRTLALFPFTQHHCKDYPGFAEALKSFAGWNFLIFGGPETQQPCESLAKKLSGQAWNLAGRTSLRQMAALIRRCRMLIGSDSCGPHIACAAGVPNIVLLGGGHFGRFMPYSPLTSAVSLPLDCFDCVWDCPHSRAHCVKDISPEILAEAIRQTLGKTSARPRLFLQSPNSWPMAANLPTWKRPDELLAGNNVEIIEIAGSAPAIVHTTETANANCPVCGAASPLAVVKKETSYHRCPQCDCVFTLSIDPKITETENSGYPARHDQKQDSFRLLRLLAALGRRPEKIVDFGCGHGETTRFLQAQGFDAVGIDKDTQVQLSDIGDESIDGIIMVEVIEHLYEPHAIFRQFNRILKTGGAVYVESSFADNKNLAEWPYLDPSIGHCTVHTLRSMALIAAKHGFKLNWTNPHVCCFTKQAAPVAKSETVTPVEIVGDGIANPLVTVVVSTYKSERFMRACLENLSHQTIFDRCEIIVIDSGSPENERAIVAEFQKKFPNIRYVRTSRESLHAAWNRSIAMARGRYWANANTDDSLRNDALELLAAALDKHPECASAYGDSVWTAKPNDTWPSNHALRTVKYLDYVPLHPLFYCYTACLQFYRIEAIRKCDGFDVSLHAVGDYEANLKFMAAGLNAVHVPEVLSLFYQNTGGLSQATDRSAKEQIEVMNRYRANLDIRNIFQIRPNDRKAAADAWTALGVYAIRFVVPWEDPVFEHLDFAIACLHKALDLDPENKSAGMNLAALSYKMGRLNLEEAELIKRWPKMREWIGRLRTGETPQVPQINYSVIGPVYRPFELSHPPTEEQLSKEPAALRPWIARIDGRHVYLSEKLFPVLKSVRYSREELQSAAKRLMALLVELPPFYAHLGGAGDALLLMASFYDQKPDAVVFSYPNGVGAAKALFDAFPKLSKIYFLPQHTDPFFHTILRYSVHELKNCLGAGTTPKHSYDEEWKIGLDVEKKYRIQKSPKWAADFRKNSGSRRIALAPKGSLAGMVGSKRNIILPEHWPHIIQHILNRGFEPVILGVPSEALEFPALPGCVDLRKETFPGQMRCIGECAGVVGADSWAKTFSALAHIPTVVFEPLKGADIANWKDPSDWVFIEPWPAIKMIRSLDDFRRVFDAHIAKVPGAALADTGRAAIAWEGSFLDYGSLSHINRELTARLAASLNLTCVGPNRLPATAQTDRAMQQCAKKLTAKAPPNTVVTIRHQWPPNWSKPASGALVVIQPWEYGSLPKAWVDAAANVDEFWVPSPAVRAMYLTSGIAPEKVRVVPNGVDTRKFRPGLSPMPLATKKKFKFLFVGGTIFRKGPDVLLEAFSQAFTSADDVCLVIKDFGGNSFYQGQTAESAIQALKQKPGAPEILYLKDEISSEQMPSLYATCQCLVLPYRGEGFGMPVLEAMACGLPVIVTAGGATESFVSDEAGWKIFGSYIRLADHIGEMKLVKPGWMLQPNTEHLVELFKLAARNPEECRRRGAIGRAIAEKRFDWNDIAAEVAHRLKELVGCMPVSTAQSVNVAPPKKAVVFKVPEVARIGQLGEARELFGQKKLEAAWNATTVAIAKRPFHPEAFLLLAEIAVGVGDASTARQCAQYARDLAPAWNPAKQFLKKNLKGSAKLEWMKLPDAMQRSKSKTQSLSVCLIVKNEEKFLAQCLKSVREIAQQIVVVDTGSTDRTIEIAKEFGAEIYHHTWSDDFAAARNAALEHATGDWILMLDADEELPAAQHARLLADMKNPAALAARLPLVNSGLEAEGQSFVPRLARNAPGAYYHGRIHEQVFSSLLPLCKAWGLKTVMGTAEILHHGYNKELVQDRNKIERNLKLLQQACEENPNDVNLAMNLGLELVRSENLTAGIAKYREAFQLMLELPQDEVAPELREVLLTQFTSQLYKIREHDEVVHILNSPVANARGLTASLHLALGLSQFELKNYAEAAEQMRQCLAKRKQPALSPINTDILTAMPNHCLALALAKINDAAGAEKAFQAALGEKGLLENVKLDYAKFLAATNRPVDALHKMHELVAANCRNGMLWRVGSEIALSSPEFLGFARDWTGEAMRYLADDPVIAAQRAEALMLNGDTAAALGLWERLWSAEPQPRALAALILCETIESQTPHVPHEPDEKATSRAFIAWYQRLLAMRAKAVTTKLNERNDKLSRALPTAAGMIEKALAEAQQPTATV